GILYVNGSEQERTPLIQNIQINSDTFKITKEQRAADAAAEAEKAKEEADAKLPHYGSKYPLGKAVIIHGVSIPTPKDSKTSASGDKLTVSIKGSAADLKDFYEKLLPRYKFQPAGSCWEHEGPARRACVDAGNNTATITVTEK